MDAGPYCPHREGDALAGLSSKQRRQISWIIQELEEEVLKTDVLEPLLDLGLSELACGEIDAAVAALELATSRIDGSNGELSARAWNALSVAYLERGRHNDDPIDLLRAIRAAEKALALLPERPEPLFNRALALTHLGTPHLGELAWEHFLAGEREEGWIAEAEQARQTLLRPTMGEIWEEGWSGIEVGLAAPEGFRPESSQALSALVRRLPFHAMVEGEEVLLPRWAEARQKGNIAAAEGALSRAERIGQILLDERGEGLLHDAVAAIRSVETSPLFAKHRHLVAGLGFFGEGMVAYHEQKITAAEALLTRSAAELDRAGNPLADRARFFRAVCLYYRNVDLGLAAFSRLEGKVSAERYPSLAGRVQWLLATANLVQGRVQTSVNRYRRAAELLESCCGPGAAAFVRVLLAEPHSLLGEHTAGWKERTTAFREVPWIEGPRRTIAMWIEAAGALARQDALDLAGPLLDEAVAVAEGWGQPVGLTTAYQQRAVYRLEIGDRQGALDDLERSQAALARMEESGLQGTLASFVVLTAGLYYLAEEPERAVELLGEALDSQVAEGYHFAAIDYRTRKAAAHARLGQTAVAEAEYLKAVGLFEEIRSTVEDPVSKMRAFRRARPAFNALIELSLNGGEGTGGEESGGADEEAFRFSERARARVLLDLSATGSLAASTPVAGNRVVREEPAFISLRELQAVMPTEAVLAVWAVLEDRTVAWVVDSSAWRRVGIPHGEEEVGRWVRNFRLEMQQGASEARLQALGEQLHDALIRPLALGPNDGRTLVLVPDSALAGLEFPALHDPRRGLYLIEERPLSLAPSATLFARALARSRAPTPALEIPALVVGVGEAIEVEGRSLDPLEEAEGEARAIAASYPGARLLIGEVATRGNFLQASVSSGMIHFAGHALVDPEAPRRSALFFHQQGESESALTLQDLFVNGFAASRLVVLSACRTVDSLADDREGMFGLAGVVYGHGVPAVIATQRNANDALTAELMTSFHRHFAAGETASAALRQAMLEWIHHRNRRRRSPAAWGHYTVIGGL